jgi:toxin ParE1/3/4
VRVKWLAQALLNLDSEANYIARDNPTAASRIVQSINRAVERLRQYPAMGRPGRVPGTRELVVPETPHIIPYRVRGDDIEILRVFHAARKWPSQL